MICYKRHPYKNNITEAYIAAVNILAVEYLIKANDPDGYSRLIDLLYGLGDEELDVLYFVLSLNRHTSSLGAMITQGDYEDQSADLLYFLLVDRESV